MKKIEAIIRPGRLEAVKGALNYVGITGMTIIEVKGCGHQKGHVQYYRGSEYVVNLLPKIKLELVVRDEQLKEAVEAIIEAARTNEVGDGKIFVSTIDEAIQVRTGEKGDLIV